MTIEIIPQSTMRKTPTFGSPETVANPDIYPQADSRLRLATEFVAPRACDCVNCSRRLQAGEGVRYFGYRQGYICQDCATELVTRQAAYVWHPLLLAWVARSFSGQDTITGAQLAERTFGATMDKIETLPVSRLVEDYAYYLGCLPDDYFDLDTAEQERVSEHARRLYFAGTIDEEALALCAWATYQIEQDKSAERECDCNGVNSAGCNICRPYAVLAHYRGRK